jgi:hypothetical protein
MSQRTGRTRYRVGYEGLICGKPVLVLQMEWEVTRVEWMGNHADTSRVNVWRDARPEDLTEAPHD